MQIQANEPKVAGLAAHKASRGMSLIEILVVLAIIGLIVGGVSVMAFGQLEKSRITTTGTDVGQLQGLCEMYKMQQQNKCPKTLSDLKAAGILSRVKKDAWNNDFVIKCPGDQERTCDVMSFGPDGQEGTDDDIVSWTEPGEGEPEK